MLFKHNLCLNFFNWGEGVTLYQHILYVVKILRCSINHISNDFLEVLTRTLKNNMYSFWLPEFVYVVCTFEIQ